MLDFFVVKQPVHRYRNKNDFAEAFINFAMVMHCLGESKFAENVLYVFRKFYSKEFDSLIVINKAEYHGVLAYIKYVKYEQSRILQQRFNYLKKALGDFTMAYELIDEELKLIKSDLIDEHIKKLAKFAHGQGTAYYFLGDCCLEQKDDKAAEKNYKQSVSKFFLALLLRTLIYGDNDVNVARSHHKLATAFIKLSKLKLAGYHFKEALKIQRKLLNKDHPNRCETELAYKRFMQCKDKKGNQYKATTYAGFYGSRRKMYDNGNINCSEFNKILGEYRKKGMFKKLIGLFKNTRSNETKKTIIKCIIAPNDKDRTKVINTYMLEDKNNGRRFNEVLKKELPGLRWLK
ncbi:MAG: tetratricopeptide repeat protein [Gammaproteobacteria bacterium]